MIRKQVSILCFALCVLALMTFGCATASHEADDLERARIEEKCRIQLGWDDPLCKFLDEDTVESIGAGGVFH